MKISDTCGIFVISLMCYFVLVICVSYTNNYKLESENKLLSAKLDKALSELHDTDKIVAELHSKNISSTKDIKKLKRMLQY